MHATRSSKPLRRRVAAALVVVAIAGAAGVLGNVAPAAADSRACTPQSRGCASFNHRGNTFMYRVCLARNARPGGKKITLEEFFCSGYRAGIC